MEKNFSVFFSQGKEIFEDWGLFLWTAGRCKTFTFGNFRRWTVFWAFFTTLENFVHLWMSKKWFERDLKEKWKKNTQKLYFKFSDLFGFILLGKFFSKEIVFLYQLQRLFSSRIKKKFHNTWVCHFFGEKAYTYSL